MGQKAGRMEKQKEMCVVTLSVDSGKLAFGAAFFEQSAQSGLENLRGEFERLWSGKSLEVCAARAARMSSAIGTDCHWLAFEAQSKEPEMSLAWRAQDFCHELDFMVGMSRGGICVSAWLSSALPSFDGGAGLQWKLANALCSQRSYAALLSLEERRAFDLDLPWGGDCEGKSGSL